MLNGSHAAISSVWVCIIIKYWLSCSWSIRTQNCKTFLDNIMNKEVIPVLKNIIDVDLDKYYNTVLNRFANHILKIRLQGFVLIIQTNNLNLL